jgi:hypothetical protein
LLEKKKASREGFRHRTMEWEEEEAEHGEVKAMHNEGDMRGVWITPDSAQAPQ